MTVRLAGLTALMLVSACASAAGLPPAPLNGDWRAVPLVVEAHQLRGDKAADEPLDVGALTYRGGLFIRSDDPGFGGFSGLILDDDGRHMLAVSDRGQWLEADLDYDVNGRLSGMSNARMSAITDKDGVVLAGPIVDAEGLDRASDGGLIVSFEREARVDAYRIDKAGMVVFDRPLAQFEPGSAPAYNEGLEAVAALGDGFLAFAEAPFPAGAAGYVFTPDGKRRPVSYDAPKSYGVTDAQMSGDDLFILERAYSPFLGVRARLHKTNAPSPGGNALKGEELAAMGAVYAIDNMEGLAVRTSADERRFVYMMSDDNYSARQKTLLLMFELNE